MMPDLLQWREPLWLLIALAPLLLFGISRIRRSLLHTDYADEHLLAWVVVRKSEQKAVWLRHLLHQLAWCCFAVAMAGPRIAESVHQAPGDYDADIMILLDVSQSMSATDLVPDRLSRARLELLDLLRDSGDVRIGLTLFSAQAHLMSPLTYDKSVIRHYLDSIEPALLPTAGSNLFDALMFASKQFDSGNRTPRYMLVLTDGDVAGDNSLPRQQQIATQLKQDNIALYILGMATTAGQTVVAQTDSLIRRPQSIQTTLQRDALKRLAILSNGAYAEVSPTDSEWLTLYENGIRKSFESLHTAQDDSKKVIWKELYELPMLAGILLLVLAFIRMPLRHRSSHVLNCICLLFIVTMVVSVRSVEASPLHDAYVAYQDGDYNKAAQLYSQLDGFEARMGEADSLYHAGEYADASVRYMQTMMMARSDDQRARVLFNLGNSLYQQQAYAQAIAVYDDVLRYHPLHRYSPVNRAHAEKQLVLQKERESETAYAGRGPATRRIADGIDLNSSGVTLNDADTEQRYSLPTSGVWIQQTGILSDAELVREEGQGAAAIQKAYSFNSVESLQSGETQKATLWKRLFEVEEGFPAPLDLPRSVPGVSPW